MLRWNLNHAFFSWTSLSSRSLVIIPRIVVFAAAKNDQAKKDEDSDPDVIPEPGDLKTLKDTIVGTVWSGATHWKDLLQKNPNAIEIVDKSFLLWGEHVKLFDGDVDGPYYVRYDHEEKFPRTEMVELNFTEKGEVEVRPFDLMVFIPYIVDINTIGLDHKNHGVL